MVVILDKKLRREIDKKIQSKYIQEVYKMVEADFSGSFLNAENADDGAVIIIVGKAVIEEKTGKTGDYTSTNIPIEIDSKPKIYSPSRESGQRMVKAWGSEMDAWVGKQAKIKHVLKQVSGVTKTYIEAYPIA